MAVNPLLIILGPTASGKTKLAVHVAARLNGEIISADSRQVFKDMDIGTGKDLTEYTLNGNAIPHHLINILEAGEKYNVNAFKEDFYKAFEQITERHHLPIVCGGTGMYIHALLQQQDFTAVPVNNALRVTLAQLNKEALIKRLSDYSNDHTAHADHSSQKRLIRAVEVAEFLTHHTLVQATRPAFTPVIIGLDIPREVLRKRILVRLEQRMAAGLIAEVEGLVQRGLSMEMLAFYGLEYKFAANYLNGTLKLTEMKERLYTAICQFAKRQVTFFKKMEKDGVKINWINGECEFDILMENVVSLKENTVITV